MKIMSVSFCELILFGTFLDWVLGMTHLVFLPYLEEQKIMMDGGVLINMLFFG